MALVSTWLSIARCLYVLHGLYQVYDATCENQRDRERDVGKHEWNWFTFTLNTVRHRDIWESTQFKGYTPKPNDVGNKQVWSGAVSLLATLKQNGFTCWKSFSVGGKFLFLGKSVEKWISANLWGEINMQQLTLWKLINHHYLWLLGV